MTDKRRNRKTATRRTEHRIKQPLDTESSRRNAKIPIDALPADPNLQVPNNSYSPPPSYYVDQEFICQDCQRREIWTAAQQKWYYEVAKGSLYARAVRCRKCRRRHQETQSGLGDPNPIKHLGSLMKQIRGRIEPWLFEAGFVVDRQSGKADPWSVWIEYASPSRLIRCSADSRRGHLTAESLNDTEWTIAVDVELGSVQSTDALLERLNDFADRLRKFVLG